MNALVFGLAAVCALLGVGLLVVDRTRRHSDNDATREQDPAVASAFAHGDDPRAGWEEGSVDTREQLTPPEQQSNEADVASASYEPDELVVDVETEEALSELPETDRQPEPDSTESLEDDTAADNDRSEEPAAGAKNMFSRVSMPTFFHTARRERKEWAARHDYDFAKTDPFLADEWNRGAAATGATARNVVSGTAYGHEMHLLDLGEATVLAMRRGSASDVVLDARRDIAGSEFPDTEDLIEATRVHGFCILSNDSGVAQRIIDERMDAALAALPESVLAVWAESNWVLAQFTSDTTAADWDAASEPLALIADAVRALPPRRGTLLNLDLSDLDPARPLPQPIRTEDIEVPAEHSDPRPAIVTRPDEPVELPSRAQQISRGVVNPRQVGDDDVAAIASGSAQERGFDGTTMLRDNSKPSTIFDDISAELGMSFTPEFTARLEASARAVDSAGEIRGAEECTDAEQRDSKPGEHN